MVLADPAGSVLADYVKTGQIGQAGLVAGRGNRRGLHAVHRRSVAREAGLHHRRRGELHDRAGAPATRRGSWPARRRARWWRRRLRYCREQTTPKRVVTFVCDSGNKYLSKMFNDFWMRDQGFLRGPPQGDLRDVMGRQPREGRGRRGGADRHAAGGPRAHEDVRRLPAPRAGRRSHRRPARRVGPPARGDAGPGRLPQTGARLHEHAAHHRAPSGPRSRR